MGRNKKLQVRDMSFRELEDAAMRGSELPTGLDFASQYTFLSLRLLYMTWRKRYISREQAEQEKHKIWLANEQNKTVQRTSRELHRYIQSCIKKGEELKSRVLKDLRNGEDVLWIALECIGAMTSDKVFVKNAEQYIQRRNHDQNTSV